MYSFIMIDLHTHSTASDGMLSPEELVDLAAERDLTAIALTDHDTVAGLERARTACGRHGITFIPGIELEVDYENGEFHLLGLDIRRWKEGFQREIVKLQENRDRRNMKIVQNMLEAGIETDYTEVKKIASGDVVGRPHFARLLVDKGVVGSVSEGFSKFLSPGKPFYEAKETIPLETASDLIHEAGGICVLAHPRSLNLNLLELEKRLIEWKEKGLDGIEAYHPSVKPARGKKLERLGKKYNLVVTAGSDYHGEVRPGRSLGEFAAGRKISDRYIRWLKE